MSQADYQNDAQIRATKAINAIKLNLATAPAATQEIVAIYQSQTTLMGFLEELSKRFGKDLQKLRNKLAEDMIASKYPGPVKHEPTNP